MIKELAAIALNREKYYPNKQDLFILKKFNKDNKITLTSD